MKYAIESKSMKSDEADVHVLIGNLQNFKGNHSEAINSYNEALQITPNDAEVIYNKACTLDKIGNLDEAIENYKKAQSLNDQIPSMNLRNALIKKMSSKQKDINSTNK